MVWHLDLWIAGGDVDYVEARTSDRLKVEVFEKVFPKAHWTGDNPEALENPPEFDFLGNAEGTGKVIACYCESTKDDLQSEFWAREFTKTYEVGKRLQELGLHPRVSIG